MLIAERPHILKETPPEKVQQEWREILTHLRVAEGDSPAMARRIARAHPGYQHFYHIRRLPGHD
jgi:predicted secreted protein